MQFFSLCDYFNLLNEILKQCNFAINISHLCAKNDFNDSKIALLLS